jgi:hypothetical protein
VDNLSTYLTKERLLYNSSLESTHRLNPLIEKFYHDKLLKTQNEPILKYNWSADRFGLNFSSFYNNLPNVDQEAALSFLSQMNLAMSWYIEKCAYNHGAKMILLSESEEEKLYYCGFTVEEAIHQKEFERLMNFRPAKSDPIHPLILPLTRCIEFADREVSVFIVQVLLEGYGLSIYKSLGESSLSQDLKLVYRRIIQDEAAHHGSGLLITEHNSFNDQQVREILDYIWEFSEAIQNPMLIRLSLESVHGKISDHLFKKLLQEINYAANAQKRLDILKGLIARVDHVGLRNQLEAKAAFSYKEII